MNESEALREVTRQWQKLSEKDEILDVGSERKQTLTIPQQQ